MPDVSVSTLRANEYNGRKVVLRDTHNIQMSIARFFQLALVGPQGQLCEPTQGYAGGHNAWDIAPVGGLEGVIPARCPVFGTVYFTQQNHEIAGNWVVVQEDTGGQFDRWHIFMHLDSIAVSEGDSISQGTSVGMIGDTGSSTGPHLHYQIATANPLETYRTSEDPMVTFDRGSLNPSWTMEGAVDAHNWDYIQLDNQATDYGPPGGGGGGGGNIKSLDIEMRINPPPEIIFNLRYPVYDDTASDENMIPVNAGYYRPNELYAVTESKLRTENYTMRDTLMTDINISWRYSLQLSEKPVLLFTTDGRDPLTHGRTVFLKQEGDFWINDYDNSANLFPTLCGFALPINVRAALIDANRHDLVLTQASAVFTRESVATVPQQSTYLRTYCQALLADADADSRYSKSDDLHGYITLNEQNEILDYNDPISGLEDGDE